MKDPNKERQELRDQIQKDTELFLSNGGKIKQIPIGASGDVDKPLKFQTGSEC